MLFVVGGNDPVVTPRSVLDSAPEGGLNLLEIGGLGHFLGGRPGDDSDQQSFWVPEVAALIDRFAARIGEKHQVEQRFAWFKKDMRSPARSQSQWNKEFADLRSQTAGSGVRTSEGKGPHRRQPAEVIAIDREGALPTALFERCLDDLMARLRKEGGMLFILRNEIPTFLLPAFVVREVASALYHEDAGIVRSCHGVAARWQFVEKHVHKICVVLPWNAKTLMSSMDRTRDYPSQSETTGGRLDDRSPAAEDVWRQAETRCLALARRSPESVRRFDGRTPIGTQLEQKSLLRLVNPLEHVAAVPDCWVWVSNEFLGWRDSGSMTMDDAIDALKEEAPKVLADENNVAAAIRDKHLRIVTVSRARFNPRFRGRLLVTAADARRMLTHAVLCISTSQSMHSLGDGAFQ